MILIISNSDDGSTINVIDWLTYYNVDFIRINPESKISLKKIVFDKDSISEFILVIDGVEINLFDIKGFWYRRGGIVLDNKINFDGIENIDIQQGIFSHLSFELHTLIDFIYDILKKNTKGSIGNFEKRHVNKLVVLEAAIKCGIGIPKTAIFQTKKDTEAFSENNKIVTKGIQTNLSTYHGNVPYNYLTADMSNYDFKTDSPNNFFPTLFQEKIEKRYEIRTFFLKGKFYSVAIFSQNNPNTQVDYRNYDFSKPNRFVPYNLPQNVENKLLKLMELLCLDTGSIDLIYSVSGDYIFLEVNPVGQYGGMVSAPGNYYLDREIAKILQGYSNFV